MHASDRLCHAFLTSVSACPVYVVSYEVPCRFRVFLPYSFALHEQLKVNEPIRFHRLFYQKSIYLSIYLPHLHGCLRS